MDNTDVTTGRLDFPEIGGRQNHDGLTERLGARIGFLIQNRISGFWELGLSSFTYCGVVGIRGGPFGRKS